MSSVISENLVKVRQMISEAKGKSPYNENVTLICVSKTVDVPKVMEAIDAGEMDFGENKPQELKSKYEKINKKVNWHQIGTLQRNKVKYIIDKARLIHSLDSIRLAEEIDKRAGEKSIKAQCLVQINISEEDSKHGIDENNLAEFIKKLNEFENIEIRGLMGMAPFEEDVEKTRSYFKQMREYYDGINIKKINRYKLTYLSMGMSNDFQIAIEEGSNMVRVGTKIFGRRNYDL